MKLANAWKSKLSQVEKKRHLRKRSILIGGSLWVPWFSLRMLTATGMVFSTYLLLIFTALWARIVEIVGVHLQLRLASFTIAALIWMQLVVIRFPQVVSYTRKLNFSQKQPLLNSFRTPLITAPWKNCKFFGQLQSKWGYGETQRLVRRFRKTMEAFTHGNPSPPFERNFSYRMSPVLRSSL